MKLSENFSEHEFKCKCHTAKGGPYCKGLPALGMSGELIQLLEAIREKAGAPVTITSGYRCVDYNTIIKGASSSQHMLATAADIRIKGFAPKQVADIANKLMPNKGGIGVYSTFTHVDVRRNKARW
jgi:uncharacterized protein YcbK (DUF882 family)